MKSEELGRLNRRQKLWDLIAERRHQPTVSRAELERRLHRMDALRTGVDGGKSRYDSRCSGPKP